MHIYTVECTVEVPVVAENEAAAVAAAAFGVIARDLTKWDTTEASEGGCATADANDLPYLTDEARQMGGPESEDWTLAQWQTFLASREPEEPEEPDPRQGTLLGD